MQTATNSTLQKQQLMGILEIVCQELELTETQYESAKSKYQAVGAWLSDGEHSIFHDSEIYPQGSFAIRTTVRPLGSDEHDLDLVCHVPKFSPHSQPSELKRLIGDRLRANGTYRDMLEEKPRCWRITYANEFHLDITPSTYNPICTKGGELVPDKRLREWKASNPRGYRIWFDDHAQLQPRFTFLEREIGKASQQVQALPGPSRLKGFLPRIVQLCKRHRDVWFYTREPELAPISIILTTLLAKSYAYCVGKSLYDNEFDLLVDVLRHSTDFVEVGFIDGIERYYVWNETTIHENFAEKWTDNPCLARSFFAWHQQAVADLSNLVFSGGLDQIRQSMSPMFGEQVVSKTFSVLTNSVTSHRANGTLAIGTGLGLTQMRPKTIPVRLNTFFGE